MSRREIPELPDGWLIALVFVLVFIVLMTILLMPARAAASPGPELPAPGLSCTLSDAWFGATVENPQDRRPWPVRVVKLQGLPTAEPGAWVQPLHGRYTAYQFQVAQARLTECRP